MIYVLDSDRVKEDILDIIRDRARQASIRSRNAKTKRDEMVEQAVFRALSDLWQDINKAKIESEVA